jgi:hypothetical protein
MFSSDFLLFLSDKLLPSTSNAIERKSRRRFLLTALLMLLIRSHVHCLSYWIRQLDRMSFQIELTLTFALVLLSFSFLRFRPSIHTVNWLLSALVFGNSVIWINHRKFLASFAVHMQQFI